jgi:hypothetical protein
MMPSTTAARIARRMFPASMMVIQELLVDSI